MVGFLVENTKIDAQLKVSEDFNDFKAGETALNIAERKNFKKILKLLNPPEMKDQVIWNILQMDWDLTPNSGIF